MLMQIYTEYQNTSYQPFSRNVLGIRYRIILKRVLSYSMNVLYRVYYQVTGKTQHLYIFITVIKMKL